MFSIDEFINKLHKHWRLLLTFILVFIGAASLCFYIQHVLVQQKAISIEQSVSTLRMQSLKAQNDGDLVAADKLYTSALTEAESSGSSMKVIEFLSRLAQIKIQNYKLGEADDLAQRAIKLALSIKDTTASDSNLEVWMNDLADAFYKRGEHSTRADVKEYCLKDYLDIKLPLEDHFDPLLIGRGHLLFNYLAHNGREAEASPYGQKVLDYLKRTKPNDPSIAETEYRSSLSTLAQKHQFVKAEFIIREHFLHKNTPGKNLCNEVELNIDLGNLRVKGGDLQAAKVYYQKAVDLEKQCTDKPSINIGIHENILGYLEQRLGNITKAAQLYRTSLDCFDHCQPPEVNSINAFLHPEGWLYSGQVFAAEHLADIELKAGNKTLARSLLARTKKIRTQNSYWAACKHPDPDSFYISAGFFPFLTETIPTHFSLQEINQK